VVEPVSTGALIIGGAAGAGAWLADKVFGPSGDALGESLRVYLSGRFSKVFTRAADLADEPASLHELPPGFLVKFVQAASFSEDDELITDLWANLLISAAKKFTNRKVLYLDILEKLSADDAKILNSIVDDQILLNGSNYSGMFVESIRFTALWTAERLLREHEREHFDRTIAEAFNDAMLVHKDSMPVRILRTMVPYVPELPEDAAENARLPSSSAVGLADSTAPFDPLIRQRLLQEFAFDFIAGFQIHVEGVMATSLGLEFVRNCRGYA
jgi:hypothetical protein